MTEKEYIFYVKQRSCVICLHRLDRITSPCEAHHAGPTEKRSSWLVVPLCPEHHRGATGVHGMHRRAFEMLWKVSDFDLLAWTVKQLLA